MKKDVFDPAAPHRVAVFALGKEERGRLERAVRAYFAETDWPVEIKVFSAAGSLARAVRRGWYIMAFVVADGPEGMAAARRLKEADRGCHLFLVGERGDYALEGFGLGALDFVLLPDVSPQRIGRAVGRLRAPALRPLTDPDGAGR